MQTGWVVLVNKFRGNKTSQITLGQIYRFINMIQIKITNLRDRALVLFLKKGGGVNKPVENIVVHKND